MKPRKLSSNIYQDPTTEKLIVKRLLVGPSTVSEIQVSLSRRVIEQCLVRLEKEGVVEKIGNIKEKKYAKPATIWGLVGQKDVKELKPRRNLFRE